MISLGLIKGETVMRNYKRDYSEYKRSLLNNIA